MKIGFSDDTTHVFQQYNSNEQLEYGCPLVALVIIITLNCGKNSGKNMIPVVRKSCMVLYAMR